MNSDSSTECSVRIHDWIVSREAAQVSYISQNKLYQSSKVQWSSAEWSYIDQVTYLSSFSGHDPVVDTHNPLFRRIIVYRDEVMLYI